MLLIYPLPKISKSIYFFSEYTYEYVINVGKCAPLHVQRILELNEFKYRQSTCFTKSINVALLKSHGERTQHKTKRSQWRTFHACGLHNCPPYTQGVL